MNHAETQCSNTYSVMRKTNGLPSVPRPSMPYGMSDDPHANERRSPCVDYYWPELPGVKCPVFEERQRGVYGGTYPEVCERCEKRLAYVYAQDPEVQKGCPRPERAALVNSREQRVKKIYNTRESCLSRASEPARKLGWDSPIDAMVGLYFTEGLSLTRICRYLHISHSSVRKELIRQGYTLRPPSVKKGGPK